jgi:hypothetical protein
MISGNWHEPDVSGLIHILHIGHVQLCCNHGDKQRLWNACSHGHTAISSSS